ncbi:hypothetical protein LguiB_034516 [Lonicera macranthoides]
MASKCNKMINRASISSLKSAFKSSTTRRTSSASMDTSPTFSTPKFPLPTRSTSPQLRRFSLSRSPAELGCVQSLLPLHCAVAVARMTSRLSAISQSGRSLSQELGTSVPR